MNKLTKVAVLWHITCLLVISNMNGHKALTTSEKDCTYGRDNLRRQKNIRYTSTVEVWAIWEQQGVLWLKIPMK